MQGFSIGSVVATIKADASGFKAGLDEAKKNVSSFKESAVSGLTSVRNASAMVTAGIVAVGAVTLTLAKDAGKYESIRDAFVGMTKDMGFSADEFEDRVAKASKGTIDNLTILTGANKALSLIGKEAFEDFGSDFEKMATLSKKAARATGQDVGFMFDSLITGVARESKLILDNLGITVDLTEAKNKYAESLGKSADELTETESKTAVLNEVMGKLESNYADVAVSSGGFQGAMQELQTELANAKVEIGTALIPVLNDLVRELTPLIKEYVPKLINLIRQGVEWFQNLDPRVQKIILALIALAPVIATVTGLILILIPIITALISPIGLVMLAVIALAVALVFYWNDIKKATFSLVETLKNKFNSFVDTLRSIGNRIYDAVVRPFVDAYNRVKQIVDDIKSKLDFTQRHSPSVLDVVKSGVKEVNKALGGLAMPIPSSIGLAGIPSGSSNSSVANVVVNMDGAIIGSFSDADMLGERIGDSIIKKLQTNVKF